MSYNLNTGDCSHECNSVDKQQHISCANKKPDTQNKPFIDEYLRSSFQYGYRDLGNNKNHLSLIPSYLIDFDPVQTSDHSLGYEVSGKYRIQGEEGCWQEFIKYQGDTVYQYLYNHETGEKREGGTWSRLIPSHLIKSIDGSKITNIKGMIGLCTKPIENYYDPVTGFKNNKSYSFLDVVSQSSIDCESKCKLVTALDHVTIKNIIIPELESCKGPLFEYDPATDSKITLLPQNLDGVVNVAIDGTTIRGTNIGDTYGGADCRNGGILTSYTYTDNDTIAGTGRPSDPARVRCVPIELVDYTDRHFVKDLIPVTGSYQVYNDTTLYRIDNQATPGAPRNIVRGSIPFDLDVPELQYKTGDDVWWVAYVNVVGGTATNVLTNSQMEIVCFMNFYENSQHFMASPEDKFQIASVGGRANFTDTAHFNLTTEKRSIESLGQTIMTSSTRISTNNVANYSDASGGRYNGQGYVLLKPGSTVPCIYEMTANFGDFVAYEEINDPVFGTNIPKHRWFAKQYVEILYQGTIKL